MTLYPVAGHRRVVFLKPLVTNPNIVVGEYSYYDDPDDPTEFERDAGWTKRTSPGSFAQHGGIGPSISSPSMHA